jgi:hypothetical protein
LAAYLEAQARRLLAAPVALSRVSLNASTTISAQ